MIINQANIFIYRVEVAMRQEIGNISAFVELISQKYRTYRRLYENGVIILAGVNQSKWDRLCMNPNNVHHIQSKHLEQVSCCSNGKSPRILREF